MRNVLGKHPLVFSFCIYFVFTVRCSPAKLCSLAVYFFCRVLGQVSCELVPPKPNRATEGILFCNLELSPMAAPGFEPGRYVAFLKSPGENDM